MSMIFAKFYFNSNIFISFCEYSSGLSPTLVLILSNIRITIIPNTQPSIVKVFAVVVTLTKFEAKNVITNLRIFSNKLYEDEILVRKFAVVKLFKYCFING